VNKPPSYWDREVDVVVIGSGAAGMPAAIVAREAGASVIVVEAEPHIGVTPSPAAATCRSAAVPAIRKNTASRIRPSFSSAI
jgi:succinate dehydrogenase/fumarate reductase flavoprotein subunit